MKTVLETINAGAAYLEKREVEDARRNMEYLLAHQLGCGRMQLYTQFDRPLEEEDLEPLRTLLKRRGEREPLQHILGTVPFFGREFISDHRALIPRPETEELLELILAELPQAPLHMLDVGCGSGVLGLSLAAERPESQVMLSDISKDAISLAKENCERLGIGNAEVFESDLFNGISGTFDVIVANLPYVSEGERASMAPELEFDPSSALFSGSDGMDLLNKFIPESFTFLRPGGLLALEIGYDQASLVADSLKSSSFTEIEVRKDLAGIPRFPFAKHP